MEIFDYDNYRVFLRELLEMKKASDPKFSIRKFSAFLGFKSASFVIHLMDGERNLSIEAVEGISECLGHNVGEAFYFKNLVLLNQAKTADERKLYAEQILRSKGYRRARPLAESQLRYFKHWHYPVLKEMISSPLFKNDVEWIRLQFRNEYSAQEIHTALEDLLALGIIVKTDGSLKVKHDHVQTLDEVTASFAGEYHRQMSKMAADSITKFSRSERDLASMTVGISKQNFEKIRDLVRRFRSELVEVIGKEEHIDAIYQLNLQFFPLLFIDSAES